MHENRCHSLSSEYWHEKLIAKNWETSMSEGQEGKPLGVVFHINLKFDECILRPFSHSRRSGVFIVNLNIFHTLF